MRAKSSESIQDRVLSRVVVVENCWHWVGAYSPNGYGAMHVGGGKMRTAHRASYEAFVGPVPSGLVLDHSCRVRGCVNPFHLRPVTTRENLLLGEGFASTNAAKRACPKGHEYSKENTMVLSSGSRRCRECDRAAKRTERVKASRRTPQYREKVRLYRASRNAS